MPRGRSRENIVARGRRLARGARLRPLAAPTAPRAGLKVGFRFGRWGASSGGEGDPSPQASARSARFKVWALGGAGGLLGASGSLSLIHI